MRKKLEFVLFIFILLRVYPNEIEIPVKGGKLYGELSLPEAAKTFPIVIIVAGSGATDRDCNNQPYLKTDAYKNTAERLSISGIASFRYDKRMVGKSQFSGFKEDDLNFEIYVDDLIQIIRFIKNIKGVSKVFLLGHSEGSLVSILAAQSEEVNGLISAAGTGRNAADVLQEQINNNPDSPEILRKGVERVLNELRNGNKVKNAVTALLPALFRQSVQPYLISWFKFSPDIEIQKLSVPCLIIQGSADIQVSVNDAKLLYSKCKSGELLIIENMTHSLKEISSSVSQEDTYSNPDIPVSKTFINNIIRFAVK
ncbi:alpha/beta hydrolase [Treponema pedis]|uniref:alpha/beta hydrolase n=1 Tax=Treponema pedis TaxID=409322 RepID=UPI003133F299